MEAALTLLDTSSMYYNILGGGSSVKIILLIQKEDLGKFNGRPIFWSRTNLAFYTIAESANISPSCGIQHRSPYFDGFLMSIIQSGTSQPDAFITFTILHKDKVITLKYAYYTVLHI